MGVSTGTVTLQDGRRLAFAQFGDPEGIPIFYFHGFPGSRLEAAFARQMLQDNGIRLLAIDRPGYGLSDFLAGRRLTDWPDDVCQFADALEIPRFAILGVSAGSPYALACARAIPERLTKVGIAGALAPLNKTALLSEMNILSRYCFATTRHDTVLARWVYGRLLGLLSRQATAGFLTLLKWVAQQPDKEALASKSFFRAIKSSMQEAYRQGWQGPYHDLVQVAQDWGFELDEVRMPIHLWHGEEDNTVPVSMGSYLANRLPACHARFLPVEGHFSMTVRYMEEAVRVLSGLQTETGADVPSAAPAAGNLPRRVISC